MIEGYFGDGGQLFFEIDLNPKVDPPITPQTPIAKGASLVACA